LSKKPINLISSLLAIVIILVAGVFVFKHLTENRPFRNLSENDVVQITVSRNYNRTLHVLNEQDINELINILRRIVIYNRDDSHTLTGGGNYLVYHIVKTDGTNIDVMAQASCIVINGVGYKPNVDVYELLIDFENNFWSGF
jgi:cell division protein YceG involved in septum cleavage